MTDLPPDPFEDTEKKAIDDRNKKRRQREQSDLKAILESVQGRRFIWRLLSETGIFKSCFDQNALSMAMKEGRRDIGLWILPEIKKVSFTVLGQMERESDSDEQSEKAEIERKKNETEAS